VFRTGKVESTHAGLPLQREERDAEEKGERLLIYRWQVAIPVEPRHLRLAIFAYTILERQKSDPATVAEVALLDSSIRAASFSLQKGEVGDYRHQ
jgi:hypothetical protein